MTEYKVQDIILERYAKVLIRFALNKGKGIKKDEVILLEIPECAKPLLNHLQKEILNAGAHPLIKYVPDGVSKEFYEFANYNQIRFFPKYYAKGIIDNIDYKLWIEASSDKHELEKINPKKIMLRQRAFEPYKEWRDKKENLGKYGWCIALYGTEAMAKEVGLSLKEYWNQIIKACYLDHKNPIGKWEKVFAEINRVKNLLNNLNIEKLHVVSKNTNLIVGIGKNRRWLAGNGYNIPSFEVFISPDWRKTNGHIYFNQPLYRYGNLIKNIYLEFKGGKVIKAKAKKGEKILREMISVKGANKIGEYSLTDSRLSRINKFMGETLYDENFGGKYGNTHLALGNAYKSSYPSNPSKVSKKKWKEMGYNESVIHTDLISTENRVVTAYLRDGTGKIIYERGKFVI